MKGLINAINKVQDKHRGLCVTIGNFDGVHRGHLAMLNRLRQEADKRATGTMVILFEPQPLEFLRSKVAPSRIYSWQEKIRCLSSEVDYVLLLRFDKKLSELSPESFVKDVLVDALDIKCILVGADFRFGHKRLGDIALLKEYSHQFGFDRVMQDTIADEAGRISSTRLRELLAAGRLQDAKHILGRDYTLTGRVIHGEKRGRLIGFPTANIELKHPCMPLSGVYAVKVSSSELSCQSAIVNIGYRPTFDGREKLLEVHILDFNEDLYGKKLEVTFIKKIREEMKFSGIESLKEQIEQDLKKVRELFKLSVIGESI